MSRSSEISSPQPMSLRGNAAPPFWSTLRKQPVVVLLHAGRLNVERYTAKSLSAFGSSNASTTATVCPAPPVDDGSRYAACRSAGRYPAGDAVAAGLPFASVTTCELQRAV